MRELREPGSRLRVRCARELALEPLASLVRAAPAPGSALLEWQGAAARLETQERRGFLTRPELLRAHARLEWLRARAFLAPRPIASGRLVRAGRAPLAFLLREELEGSEPLEHFLARADDPLRADVLEELARECARLEALHSHAGPVLVLREGRAGRVCFLHGRAELPRLEGAEGERFELVRREELAAQRA